MIYSSRTADTLGVYFWPRQHFVCCLAKATEGTMKAEWNDKPSAPINEIWMLFADIGKLSRN